MTRTSGKRLALGVVVVAMASAAVPAQAEDFFSALFGGIARGRAPDMSMPFATDSQPRQTEQRPRVASTGRQAFCVRTCDGRYFPITAGDNQSRAASCNNFCPTSETKIVYGSSIDSAATEAGKPYSEFPNAFKYRTELVAGCTCNGKDQIGLAPVNLKDDPTLRKGDIVAGADGLMVTDRSVDRRGASLNLSPVSPAIRAKYQRVPVVAQD